MEVTGGMGVTPPFDDNESPIDPALERDGEFVQDPYLNDGLTRAQQELAFRRMLGMLSWYEYKQLNKKAQKVYRRRHGRPKAPEEKKAWEKTLAKRKRKRELAKESRRRNR